MSVAKTLSNLNGKRVVKRVSGVHTVETLDKMRDEIKAMLELNKDMLAKQNLTPEDLDEDEMKFSIGTAFWMIPKLRAEEFGVLHVRSKDYYFVPEGTDREIYGDKKGFTYSPCLAKLEKPLLMNAKANNNGLVSFELA
tara:strand:+ start:6766 stop:7182 length:417 start_codon:yes stop_codon:yes gene_type:complete